MNIKHLMVKLNQVFSQYLGKIMYALFLISILDTFLSFIILSPVMRMVQNGVSMSVLKTGTFFLAFVAIVVWLTLQFGFSVMLLQMTRRHNTNLGFIFIGFKHFNPAGKIIASFAAFIALLAVIARFIAKFVFLKIYPDFSFSAPDIENLKAISENTELFSQAASQTLLFIALFLLILFILGLCLLIRFVFVFQLHFDNPKMNVISLFRKSASLMHKNVLLLILFALRAGGKQFLAAVALATIVNFLPENKLTGLSVISFLLNIAYLVNFYTAMIRVYLTVPVLYEEILSLTERKENTEEVQNNPQITTDL